MASHQLIRPLLQHTLLTSTPAQQGVGQQGGNIAVMETSKGTVKIALYEKEAPITVNNFKNLVQQKFYDGTIFHRVIKGFMNQGGGYDKDYKNKGAREGLTPIQLEINPKLRHEAGAISMARTNNPDSATCQFFLAPQPIPHLDGDYAVFGKVVEGMDVVKAINQVPTETKKLELGGSMQPSKDVPAEPVVIKSVRLEDSNS